MGTETHPLVGILGGMGPEATVDLLRRVVAATPADDDADHVHLIVDHNPKVPSRIKALIEETGESPLPTLQAMARRLEAAGAGLLAMPCNTAHHYLPGIREAVRVPCLDMIALTVERLRTLGVARVGLLASSAVLKLGLYERTLAVHGITLAVPADQDRLMEVIRAVKRGDQGEAVRDTFRAIAGQLGEQDPDCLVIACTELSVLADSLARDTPVLDALDVLVAGIVAFGRGTASNAVIDSPHRLL